jgi:hypothetical protein
MNLRNRKLVRARLARPVPAGDRPGTKRPAAADLAEPAELLCAVADGDVDDPVVREEGQGGECGGFLAAVLRAGRDEDCCELFALRRG